MRWEREDDLSRRIIPIAEETGTLSTVRGRYLKR